MKQIAVVSTRHTHTLIHTYINAYIHVYINTCVRICLYIYKSEFLHTDIMERKLKNHLKIHTNVCHIYWKVETLKTNINCCSVLVL